MKRKLSGKSIKEVSVTWLPFFLKSSVQSVFFYHAFILQFNSVTQLCPTLCDPMNAARQASLSITNSWSLLKHVHQSVMPSNHLICCHPLLLPPSMFPSIRVFSNESILRIRWQKYWSFSFNPSNEYSGLIFFRIDWFDLLAVQGTLKSLLHHGSKASILHTQPSLCPALKSIHDLRSKPLTHNFLNPWSRWSNLEGLRRW